MTNREISPEITDTDEYFDAYRAMVDRPNYGDGDLAYAARLAAAANELRWRSVADARRRGLTWDEVGHQIGMSKQAAHYAFTAWQRAQL